MYNYRSLKFIHSIFYYTPGRYMQARGNECYKDGKYEEAKVWYSKGLAICDASKEPEFTATLLTNRAECNRQLCEIKAVVGGVRTRSQPPGVSAVFFELSFHSNAWLPPWLSPRLSPWLSP